MTYNQDNRMSSIISNLEDASVELGNFLKESLEPQERMLIEEAYNRLNGVIASLYETMEE